MAADAMVVECLSSLPEGIEALVADSEQAHLKFVRKLVTDWAANTNRFALSGEAVFAARQNNTLVGVCGLNIDPYTQTPAVGRVRHLYVLSTARNQGAGRALVTAVIEAARGTFTTLRLSTTNPTAARLYERYGFTRTPGENSTHVLRMTSDTPGR